MKYDSQRNITRFTYEFTSFQGWRLAICRNHLHYTRYFSDKQFGGEEEAHAAALAAREELERQLALHPDEPGVAFMLCDAEHLPNAHLHAKAQTAVISPVSPVSPAADA